MNASNPTRYDALNAVLRELVNSQQAILNNNLLACYLQGSFALGDGDEYSDVDFLVVIERNLSDEELAKLRVMHNRIFDLHPAWSNHLEGSYFPGALLKQPDPNHTPIWYIDNGSRMLERSAHDNDLVVRWVTREHGIPLYGADAKTLIDPVPETDLKQEVSDTMHEWGQEILDGRYTSNNQWAQAFIVLSYCRMLHTLATGKIQSKPAGVTWAKDNLDNKWHGLIQRAWHNRPNPSQKVRQPANPQELERTFSFIHYALEISQT